MLKSALKGWGSAALLLLGTALFAAPTDCRLQPRLCRFAAPQEATDTDRETRTAQIRARWKLARPTFSGDIFAQKPHVTAPYVPGALNPDFVRDGLAMVNFARFLAGLPDDVVLDDALMNQAQHGALLLGAVKELTHRPAKPPDMSERLYKLGYECTSSSNLGWGSASLADFTRSCLDDSDAGNIDRLGHRRWILNPPLKRTGFGFVSSGDWETRFMAMQVFDASRAETAERPWISWPASGPFPTEFMDAKTAWSLSLSPQVYAAPVPADLRVILTRDSDGTTWNLREGMGKPDDASRYCHLDTQGFGIPLCLIFRPDHVASYAAGETYQVEITGLRLQNGQPAALRYAVQFFALEHGTRGRIPKRKSSGGTVRVRGDGTP